MRMFAICAAAVSDISDSHTKALLFLIESKKRPRGKIHRLIVHNRPPHRNRQALREVVSNCSLTQVKPGWRLADLPQLLSIAYNIQESIGPASTVERTLLQPLFLSLR